MLRRIILKHYKIFKLSKRSALRYMSSDTKATLTPPPPISMSSMTTDIIGHDITGKSKTRKNEAHFVKRVNPYTGKSYDPDNDDTNYDSVEMQQSVKQQHQNATPERVKKNRNTMQNKTETKNKMDAKTSITNEKNELDSKVNKRTKKKMQPSSTPTSTSTTSTLKNISTNNNALPEDKGIYQHVVNEKLSRGRTHITKTQMRPISYSSTPSPNILGSEANDSIEALRKAANSNVSTSMQNQKQNLNFSTSNKEKIKPTDELSATRHDRIIQDKAEASGLYKNRDFDSGGGSYNTFTNAADTIDTANQENYAIPANTDKVVEKAKKKTGITGNKNNELNNQSFMNVNNSQTTSNISNTDDQTVNKLRNFNQNEIGYNMNRSDRDQLNKKQSENDHNIDRNMQNIKQNMNKYDPVTDTMFSANSNVSGMKETDSNINRSNQNMNRFNQNTERFDLDTNKETQKQDRYQQDNAYYNKSGTLETPYQSSKFDNISEQDMSKLKLSQNRYNEYIDDNKKFDIDKNRSEKTQNRFNYNNQSMNRFENNTGNKMMFTDQLKTDFNLNRQEQSHYNDLQWNELADPKQSIKDNYFVNDTFRATPRTDIQNQNQLNQNISNNRSNKNEPLYGEYLSTSGYKIDEDNSQHAKHNIINRTHLSQYDSHSKVPSDHKFWHEEPFNVNFTNDDDILREQQKERIEALPLTAPSSIRSNQNNIYNNKFDNNVPLEKEQYMMEEQNLDNKNLKFRTKHRTTNTTRKNINKKPSTKSNVNTQLKASDIKRISLSVLNLLENQKKTRKTRSDKGMTRSTRKSTNKLSKSNYPRYGESMQNEPNMLAQNIRRQQDQLRDINPRNVRYSQDMGDIYQNYNVAAKNYDDDYKAIDGSILHEEVNDDYKTSSDMSENTGSSSVTGHIKYPMFMEDHLSSSGYSSADFIPAPQQKQRTDYGRISGFNRSIQEAYKNYNDKKNNYLKPQNRRMISYNNNKSIKDNVVENVQNDINQVKHKVYEAIENKTSEATDKVMNNIFGINKVKNIKETAENVLDSAGGVIKNVVYKVADTVTGSKLAHEAVESVKNVTGKAKDKVKDKVEDVLSTNKFETDSTQELVNKVRNNVENISGKVEDKVENTASNLSNMTKNILNKAENLAQEAVHKVESMMPNMNGNLLNEDKNELKTAKENYEKIYQRDKDYTERPIRNMNLDDYDGGRVKIDKEDEQRMKDEDLLLNENEFKGSVRYKCDPQLENERRMRKEQEILEQKSQPPIEEEKPLELQEKEVNWDRLREPETNQYMNNNTKEDISKHQAVS